MQTIIRIRKSATAGKPNTWEQGITKLESMHELLQAKRNAQLAAGLAGVKQSLEGLQQKTSADKVLQEGINKEMQESLLKTNTNVDALQSGVGTLTSDVSTLTQQQTDQVEVMGDFLKRLENLERVRSLTCALLLQHSFPICAHGLV